MNDEEKKQVASMILPPVLGILGGMIVTVFGLWASGLLTTKSELNQLVTDIDAIKTYQQTISASQLSYDNKISALKLIIVSNHPDEDSNPNLLSAAEKLQQMTPEDFSYTLNSWSTAKYETKNLEEAGDLNLQLNPVSPQYESIEEKYEITAVENAIFRRTFDSIYEPAGLGIPNSALQDGVITMTWKDDASDDSGVTYALDGDGSPAPVQWTASGACLAIGLC